MIKTVFTTDRSEFHQQMSLDAAPDELDITMLRNPDRATLTDALADAVYLISERAGTIDADLLFAAPKLRLIQRLGRLTHDIDTNAAKARGVAVAWMPDPGVIHVAEHVMMQMLTLAKRAKQVEQVALAASNEWGARARTDEDTFRFNWSEQRNIKRLWGATVGIVGMGEIGIELAARLAGWGCTVLYNKRHRYPVNVESEFALTYADKDAIYRKSDFVVNLLPYFPATDMSIGAAAFNAMSDDAIFVSAGSGSVVDEAALANAIKSGKLMGAALDTFEYEPIAPDNPLIELVREGYNVLLTPHTAAAGVKSGRERDYANILRHMKGDPLKYRVV
jgi:phosphoglycerate dehydrogenase-like enzyme